MASGIADAFARAKQQQRTALVPYLMGGHPDADTCVETAFALAQAGADVLELGVPFSDPLADGPTIQRAATAALDNGTTTASVLEIVRRVRARTDVPIVLMGYCNPILQYGIARFADDAAAAGVDGLIVADLPVEEAQPVTAHLRRVGIAPVFLVAPTSTDERIARAAQEGGGFLYCVSLTGVTGARAHLSEALGGFVARVRSHSNLPLAVGFGIATAEHVATVARHADGAVVGSALLDELARHDVERRPAAAAAFLQSLAAGS